MNVFTIQETFLPGFDYIFRHKYLYISDGDVIEKTVRYLYWEDIHSHSYSFSTFVNMYTIQESVLVQLH